MRARAGLSRRHVGAALIAGGAVVLALVLLAGAGSHHAKPQARVIGRALAAPGATSTGGSLAFQGWRAPARQKLRAALAPACRAATWASRWSRAVQWFSHWCCWPAPALITRSPKRV